MTLHSAVLIAVDPGTHFAGISVWELDEPEATALRNFYPIALKDRPSPERLYEMYRTAVDYCFYHKGDGQNYLVAEHLKGRGVQPAPELDVLCRGFEQWAKANGWEYWEYTPQSWHAVARIRGAGEPDKEAIRWAMEARFPGLKELRQHPAGMDAIEAVGLGLHHYSKVRLQMKARP